MDAFKLHKEPNQEKTHNKQKELKRKVGFQGHE